MAQFKRVWLPYKVDTKVRNSTGMVETSFSPIDFEDTKKADAEIQNLITQGWKIVSTAPIIKSYNLINHKGDDIFANYTSGVEVFMVKD
jgi:hypothetical protein